MYSESRTGVMTQEMPRALRVIGVHLFAFGVAVVSSFLDNPISLGRVIAGFFGGYLIGWGILLLHGKLD